MDTLWRGTRTRSRVYPAFQARRGQIAAVPGPGSHRLTPDGPIGTCWREGPRIDACRLISQSDATGLMPPAAGRAARSTSASANAGGARYVMRHAPRRGREQGVAGVIRASPGPNGSPSLRAGRIGQRVTEWPARGPGGLLLGSPAARGGTCAAAVRKTDPERLPRGAQSLPAFRPAGCSGDPLIRAECGGGGQSHHHGRPASRPSLIPTAPPGPDRAHSGRGRQNGWHEYCRRLPGPRVTMGPGRYWRPARRGRSPRARRRPGRCPRARRECRAPH